MAHSLPYAANCSLLFTELPLLERPHAARDAGFTAIEFWWPWPEQPVPGDLEVDAFVGAIRDAGVELIGLNFFAGNLAGADAGAVSVPALSAAFRENIPVTIGIGDALGVKAFNALYGVRVADASPEEQDDLAFANLTLATDAAATLGATVLIEPVSGPKPYPLRTAADVAAVINRVDASNLGFLCDLFHLANNADDVRPSGGADDVRPSGGDDDIDVAIATYADLIAHVQIADWPGRGEPGTGTLDLDRYLAQIQAAGYSGHVALEYVPTTTTTLESLEWLTGAADYR